MSDDAEPVSPPSAQPDRHGWLPIETAPEGVSVKVIQSMTDEVDPLTAYAEMVMSYSDGAWFWEPTHVPSSTVPTHWQPLPPPPEVDDA